jgi:hypothetical protein
MPLLSADSHGGRIAGTLVINSLDPRSAGALREYTADLHFADVSFSGVLHDLAVSATPPSPPVEGPSADLAPADDLSRGAIDGEFSVAGLIGQPVGQVPVRRGRGVVHVSGGRILSLPLVLPLLEVTNLQLPSAEHLDFAQGSFFIDNDLVTIEDVSIFSRSIAIFGYGTMTYPGLVLDLRVNSRSNRPIPLVSEVIQGIRDELVSTRVTGKLGVQKISLEPFQGTRRLLNRAFGGEQTAQQQRLDEIERRAKRERERDKRAGDRGRRLPTGSVSAERR